MADTPRTERLRALLLQRLREAARVLLPIAPETDDPYELLDALAESVRDTPAHDRLWLLFTATAGAFPTPAQFESLRRRLVLCRPGEARSTVLEETLDAASAAGEWERPLRVVEGVTVVDVNFCAKFVHNTGIQRVVREVIPHLLDVATSPVELVAWTRRSGLLRGLTAVERQRVVAWRELAAGQAPEFAPQPEELIVPWHSRVFLPEVPEPALVERLAALAEFSGNRVSLIGYDTIPIASADLVAASEAERFARYLSVVKHADEVVAISRSVADEFGGFLDALAAQGLAGPRVTAVPLAADVPPQTGEAPAETPVPVILSVGSHEPRKNQDAVLFAAERLLAEGHRFRLVFVGGGSRTRTLPFDRHLRELRARHGWNIESVRGMRDRELWQLYRSARFSVFPSLHEGYGLPVVESLALGTPVLTGDYGSLAEIAANGGCLTVDPRDDDAITDGMRALLTDDQLIARLTAEAARIPPRSWHDYATELWSAGRLGEHS